MSLMSWLPLAFKDLIQHVPTLVFEVISWSELTREIRILSKRLVSGEGKQKAIDLLEPKLPSHIRISDGSFNRSEFHQDAGEHLLSLYFVQILNSPIIFLDLRLHHFSQNENHLDWNPSNLWTAFSPQFSQGIKNLYIGFYQSHHDLFMQGLLETGLIQNSWPQADQNKMAELLKSQFGSSIEEPQYFTLNHFQKSFHHIFEFLMIKKSHISTDFMILGVMLVTLYLSLEKLGRSYDVKKIFLDVLNKQK
jgi:hypothetical protein